MTWDPVGSRLNKPCGEVSSAQRTTQAPTYRMSACRRWQRTGNRAGWQGNRPSGAVRTIFTIVATTRTDASLQHAPMHRYNTHPCIASNGNTDGSDEPPPHFAVLRVPPCPFSTRTCVAVHKHDLTARSEECSSTTGARARARVYVSKNASVARMSARISAGVVM
jgi:hypothetical protein